MSSVLFSVDFAGANPGIFDRGVPGFSRKCEVEAEFFEVDSSTELLLKGVEGVFGGLPQKKIEISGSGKVHFGDPEDGFAMDNRESKKPLGLIGDPDPPDPPPGSATVNLYLALLRNKPLGTIGLAGLESSHLLA